MARERMVILYDQSSAFKGLVVGTGNKTEILLGYTTLYGDSANALNPIGDLYKTQLRQLARALGVPKSLIDKAPSADLWVGQTDEGELGFTYAEVDQLLYLLIDQRYTPQECIDAGFAESFVHAVVERVRRNHFKRILPPSPRSATAPSAMISFTSAIGVPDFAAPVHSSRTACAQIHSFLDRPARLYCWRTDAVLGAAIAYQQADQPANLREWDWPGTIHCRLNFLTGRLSCRRHLQPAGDHVHHPISNDAFRGGFGAAYPQREHQHWIYLPADGDPGNRLIV